MTEKELLKIKAMFDSKLIKPHSEWSIVSDCFVYNSYTNKKKCALDFLYLKENPNNKNIKIQHSFGYPVWYPYYPESFEW